MTREEAFAAVMNTIDSVREVLQPWEYDSLVALAVSLANQSDATAQDRQRHGFVR